MVETGSTCLGVDVESSSGPANPVPAPRRTRGVATVVVAIMVAAFSLRPAMTSVGPLLEEVRRGLGMNSTVAGALTSLPALCFAIVGTTAPRLARRFGPGAVVGVAMVMITAGLALRPLTHAGLAGFLALSALALAGIGMANVLMPVLVKRHFPHRVGLLTGLYSMSLTAGAALAAATTVPISAAFGHSWRIGLGVWALPAAIAVVATLALLRRHSMVDGGRPRSEPVETEPGRRFTDGIVRSRTAWALAVFFGLQASAAYIVLGWLPQILRDAGVSADTAGLMLAITPAVGIPFALLMPAIASRLRHQGALAAGLSLIGLLGYAGLWAAPAAAPWLWAILLGISQSAFPLALTMIGLRSRTTAGVARLSTFAQGVGYLISMPCPVIVGALYQHTGHWGLPIAFMAALLIVQAGVGVLAGRSRFVEDDLIQH